MASVLHRGRMRYCVSDIHGEYDLFTRLLERIGFSDDDEMYVCGDVIDKGEDSVRLAKLISSLENVRCIIGNHELQFLNYYDSVMEDADNLDDEALLKLREYFPKDAHFLDSELVEWINSLPTYIEEDDFICVHAGVPLDSQGRLLPLEEARVEELVYDRKFKNPDVIPKAPKCVFFGHTETSSISGEDRIIKYLAHGVTKPRSVLDYCKIHLDTGAWRSGVLGCFCIDSLTEIYV